MPHTTQLVDTHCHIHEQNYPLDRLDVLARAREAGVEKLICVGTSEQSSRDAVQFAGNNEGVYATVGVHPHDTKDGYEAIAALAKQPKVVAIGEIGLDYYYNHSPRDVQIAALEAQLQIAYEEKLAVSFHVREAFEDFWPVFDTFSGVRGVLHSFTDTSETMEQALRRDLYFGVNGISTFTKDDRQKAMFMAIPLERLLLETDAPFLTPAPFRGKMNEPGLMSEVAKHHAHIRKVSVAEIARETTANAEHLFGLV